MTYAECPHCHERNTLLALCPDCERPCCRFCWMTENCCPPCAPARRAADATALRWYERRGALGEAPAPEMRADLVQRGLLIPGPRGLEPSNAGRAVLDDVRCPTSGEPAEDCRHMDADDFNPIELGGESGGA